MPTTSLPISTRLVKVAFVAFDFFRVRTITVEKCFPDAIFLRELYKVDMITITNLCRACITINCRIHTIPISAQFFRWWFLKETAIISSGGFLKKPYFYFYHMWRAATQHCMGHLILLEFMLIMHLLVVFDLDVIPFYICHGEIYSCDLFVLCILLLGKLIDRLMEFYTRKI
ncbi:hypothetical protein ACJX0J_019269, partial [Zea mays]